MAATFFSAFLDLRGVRVAAQAHYHIDHIAGTILALMRPKLSRNFARIGVRKIHGKKRADLARGLVYTPVLEGDRT